MSQEFESLCVLIFINLIVVSFDFLEFESSRASKDLFGSLNGKKFKSSRVKLLDNFHLLDLR